jgi:uncharacterized membrane protein YebE (DUF533 family)
MDDLMMQIAEPLGALLLVMANAALAMAVRWINQHTKNQKVQQAATTLNEVVTAEVARLNQQVVDALKNDGKFDDNERYQIKQTALNAITKQLPAGTQKAAQYMVQDLEAYISALIERAVAAAKGPPAPPKLL